MKIGRSGPCGAQKSRGMNDKNELNDPESPYSNMNDVEIGTKLK